MQIIILYTLKDDITRDDFHQWIRNVDYPTMRGLSRVQQFRALECKKLLIGDEAPSAQYVEVFDIPDISGFLEEDMPTATVLEVMEQFLGFAQTPEFIIAEEVQ